VRADRPRDHEGIISEYLVKLLVDDSVASSSYDHFAFAIQELLKLLCPPPKGRRDAFDDLDRDVRQLIELVRRSKFILAQPERAAAGAVAEQHHEDDSEWLYQFSSQLLSVSKRLDPEWELAVFHSRLAPLAYLPALAGFILPYLVAFHTR
jgi:hypothetical protein